MAREDMTKKELLAELEEREERLQESEERWRGFVDGADDLVTQVDGEGRFLYVNDAARKVFGLEPEECIGELAFEFIHPDDQERTMASFAGWVGDRVRSASFENRQVAKSGEVHHMLWTVNPRYDDEGNMRELWSIARDVSEQKLAEETLRISLALQRVRNEILQMEGQKDWEKVVQCLQEEMAEKVRFDACGVNLVDLQTGEWAYYAVDAAGELTRNSFEEIHPAIAQAMESGVHVYRPDPSAPLYGDMPPDIQSVIDIPFGGGTLAVNSSRTNAFSPRDIEIMEQFAGVLSEGHRRLEDLMALSRQERELRQHRDHLEEMVQERTDELGKTNVQLQEEIEAGKRREEVIRQQTEEILELSTPVMQMWEGVVVAPLIGSLDSQRTQRFMEVLLQRIVDTNSPVALVDITGVPTIDTQTAQNLIETVSAVRLLGAKVILTGVRPAIAQTLVHLGIDLSDVETCTSLAAGLRLALGGNGIPCGANERRL